jgi:hypothetical protein
VIGIDTNLLVYAHRGDAPQHGAALRALEQAVSHTDGWGIPLGAVTEFWSVVTHRAAPGGPSTPAQAMAFLNRLLEDGDGQVWVPGTGFGQRLLQLAVDLGITGPRVFDLQIGLVAFENGACELWTHDRHFQAVPGLRLRHPL